ncbi:MAG: ferredoxin [Candidatus Pacebacteria bacterium]|nr:ferredoxin [Candidatus Paceibacterota bacterium]
MQIKIDQSKCIGCGTCSALCPACFELGSDGKATAKQPAETGDAGCAREAADSCPAQCIVIE